MIVPEEVVNYREIGFFLYRMLEGQLVFRLDVLVFVKSLEKESDLVVSRNWVSRIGTWDDVLSLLIVGQDIIEEFTLVVLEGDRSESQLSLDSEVCSF
jgi:hypothetical protein